MEVGEGACPPFVGGEILLEPPHLGGAGAAAHPSLTAVAVEGNDVPPAQVVGVVALIGVSGGLAEVVVVGLGPFSVVLVVAGDGLGALLEAAPRRPVASLEVRRRAPGVGLVAQGEDRPVDATDELGSGLVALG